MGKILVTGGCGFIGSNFIRYMLRNFPDVSIRNLDLLTYAGNPENLADVASDPRYDFVKGSIADPQVVREAARGVEAIFNFAAESHVDRSIESPALFLETNVKGTLVLLQAALEEKVGRFIQISTDEVYGSLGSEGDFREDSPLRPNSPYAASKAAADLLVRSFQRTYGLDAIITRSSNNYGPYQFPEKLIPLMVTNALEDKELPVYGDGLNIRDWVYVEDHCRALQLIWKKGKAGDIYNIGGGCQLPNIEVVRRILKLLGKPESLIAFVADRPGHDRRYAMSYQKIRCELGWEPTVRIEEGLKRTVEWYIEHRQWWEKIKSGQYRKYYSHMYGKRKRLS